MTSAARHDPGKTPASATKQPSQWTEKLADGRRVTIRPIRPDDVQRNAAFLERLSPPSKHFLFLGAMSQFSDEQLRRLCELDHGEDMAFVAIADGDGTEKPPRQVGVCRYAGATDTAHGAEISVAVADDWQHQGLGKLLLRRLIDYARSHGVARLYSMDSIYNDRMRKLARDLGFAEHADPQDSRQVIFSLMLR
jgi:RimJ/RimL family protein N-acetyltransferase